MPGLPRRARRRHVRRLRDLGDHRDLRRGAERIDAERLDLDGARLPSTDLRIAALPKSSLRGADLRGARLNGIDLSGSDLRGADLTGAVLQGADLRGCNLVGAILDDADLSESRLDGATIVAHARNARFDRATMQGTHVRSSVLVGAHFDEADIVDAQLVSCDLRAATFVGADLSHTDVVACDLRDANLSLRATVAARIVGECTIVNDDYGVHVEHLPLAPAERERLVQQGMTFTTAGAGLALQLNLTASLPVMARWARGSLGTIDPRHDTLALGADGPFSIGTWRVLLHLRARAIDIAARACAQQLEDANAAHVSALASIITTTGGVASRAMDDDPQRPAAPLRCSEELVDTCTVAVTAFPIGAPGSALARLRSEVHALRDLHHAAAHLHTVKKVQALVPRWQERGSHADLVAAGVAELEAAERARYEEPERSIGAEVPTAATAHGLPLHIGGQDVRSLAFGSSAQRYALLTAARCTLTSFAGKDLRDASFLCADVRGADLSGTDLRRSDLRGAWATRATFRGADLSGACVDGADLREADLRGATLRFVDLRQADVRGADLTGAQLVGCALTGAQAREVRGAALRPDPEHPGRWRTEPAGQGASTTTGPDAPPTPGSVRTGATPEDRARPRTSGRATTRSARDRGQGGGISL